MEYLGHIMEYLGDVMEHLWNIIEYHWIYRGSHWISMESRIIYIYIYIYIYVCVNKYIYISIYIYIYIYIWPVRKPSYKSRTERCSARGDLRRPNYYHVLSGTIKLQKWTWRPKASSWHFGALRGLCADSFQEAASKDRNKNITPLPRKLDSL